MLLSINWLKDFVKLPKSISPFELRDKLTMHTVEVEGITDLAKRYDRVIVGKVLSVEPHPNADRLRLTKVDVRSEVLEIVCGAPNVAVGQLVPVALVGAQLPNGLEIKESEIRGVKSRGMICAEDELGLGHDHSGIMVLDRAKIGQEFSAYLNHDDIILEIDNKSLSNRSDLWGQYGLAREVATIFDLKLKPYSDFIDLELKLEAKEKLSLKIEDAKLCPRYQAIKIDGIKIQESPAWLKDRLLAVGLKPINNVVDLTNYVMWELGQPLHAFAADNIKQIVVRRAKRQESLVTLDEVERHLSEDMLLVTDGKKPLAIAGVMGGLESGIKAETRSIILESANFEPVSIRKTSSTLGLRTEASMRFEKGLDPNLSDLAWRRFIFLLKQVCPDMVLGSQLSESASFNLYLGPVQFSHDWLCQRLGFKIDKKKIIHILEKLGFSVSVSHNEFSALIPTWRAAKDVSSKEDILEEVARIYGYDNIEAVWPVVQLRPPLALTENELERQVQDILAKENHFTEIYNYSFVNETQLKKLNLDWSNNLRLVNPISEQHTLLRQNLLVGLLNNVRTNQFNYEEIALFEIGRVFKPLSGTINKDNNGEFLPYQDKFLALLIASNQGDSFANLKGRVNNFLQSLLGQGLETNFLPLEEETPWASKGLAAKVCVGNVSLGLIARVSEDRAGDFGLKKACSVAEIDWRSLHDLFLQAKNKKYEEPARYPALTRDLAFVIPQKVLYNEIREEIKNFSELIVRVELFDVYSGSKLASNLKSLAFHLSYQSPERTLKASEVDELQSRLVSHLENKFEAQLRNF
ncbi:MAG: phenylalanine--tRNA ligase subunit beta [Patescibacteria group bacterium]